jgi:hypothetical protein
MAKKSIAPELTSEQKTEMEHREVINAAFATIAAELYVPTVKQVKDEATGEITVSTVNQMAYTQQRVMNGICYSIELTLKGTRSSLDKACVELTQLVRSNRGDEISIRNVNSKRVWIERLEAQEQVILSLFGKAKRAYREATGDGYIGADTQRANREAAAQRPLNPALDDAAKVLARRGYTEKVQAPVGAYSSDTESSDPGERGVHVDAGRKEAA